MKTQVAKVGRLALRTSFPLVALLSLACTDLGEEAELAAQELSFAQDVQPVLNAHCTACHGGEGPSGGLLLESYNGLIAGGLSGAAIVAFQADSSLLVQRIEAEDDTRMPQGGSLGSAEIQLIRTWIGQGAQDN